MAASPKPHSKRPNDAPAAQAGPAGVVGVAHARFVRGSTHKTREVARLVKARPVAQALAILATANKRPAHTLSLIVRSATANAMHRYPQLNEQSLRIARILVNDGPMWKRFRAAAMGRATKIRKRTSHITVEIAATR